MKIDELNQQLVHLYESGRYFEFLAESHHQMAAIPGTRVLAPLVLRALVEAGLGGPARELVQLCSELRPNTDAGRALEERLAALQPGRVAWDTLGEVFAKNLVSLKRHHPDLVAPMQDSVATLRTTQLYRTRAGAYYLSRRKAGSFREWIYELTPREEDASLSLPSHGESGPIAVVGLRTGGLIDRIYADSARFFMNLSHPVYLFEPAALHMAAWLHVADHTHLLDDERVYLFLGETGIADFEELLVRDVCLLFPAFFVNQTNGASFAQAVHDAGQRADQERIRESKAQQDTFKVRYLNRDTAYWAKRWRKPGTVLGITSRHTTVLQHSMRDTLDALGELGWQTELIIEQSNHHQYSPQNVCRRILEIDPDLIILLDHLRYENSFLPKNLPLLTWIQDRLPNLLCHKAGSSVGPLDFVCGYYKNRCVEEFGYPANQFISTVFPVSARMFHDGPASPELLAKYACDVSFMSNASAPLETYQADAVTKFPAEWRPMLDELYACIVEHVEARKYLQHDHGLPAIILDIVARNNLTISTADLQCLNNQYAFRLYDWRRRQQSLEWVGAWAKQTQRTFRLYGRGWEQHPTLGDFAGGEVEHGEPLRCAYRASKIVLQLVPSGFRHQRSFELLSSGTLPLTRYCGTDFMSLSVAEFVRRRDAGMALDWASGMFPRLERVTFDSPEEFAMLADQYLTNESLRLAVIQDLSFVVQQELTYDAVLSQVTNFIRNALSTSCPQTVGAGVPA